jgi:hypothetical protein
MEPSIPSIRRFSPFWALAIGIGAIAVRLPFLLKAEGFFNADEAVEGLMALHLDEWPIFFWGQGYKGVPEVYLFAAVFALFGIGVMQMKAVTLALWAVAVVAVSRLAFCWYGSQVMAVTAALLIVATPVMVSYSLSGNAEVVVLTTIVATMLQLCWPSPGAATRPIPLGAWILAGLALWIHPVASCALAAFALIVALDSKPWRRERWRVVTSVLLARDLPTPFRVGAIVLHVAIALVGVAFVFMYMGGSFESSLIRATHPQRALRPIGVLIFVALVAHALSGRYLPRRRALAALGAFGIGLLPIIVQAARGGGVGVPITTRYLSDLPWLTNGVWTLLFPAYIGIAEVSGDPIGLAWWSALPFAAAIAAGAVFAWTSAATHPERLYPLIVNVAALGLLTVGGGFGGTPSIRYLLPFFCLTAMLAAAGIVGICRSRVRWIAVFTAACLASFVIGQARWYSTLFVDPSPTLITSCLEAKGLRFARGDYWIAYRLTFLSHERVLVAPDEQDRYPPYRRAVDAAAPVPRIDNVGKAAEQSHPEDRVLCTSPLLRAVKP